MAAVVVACVAVSQTLARAEYRAEDYQVCLLEGKAVTRSELGEREEPEQAVLRTLRERTGLRGNAAFSPAVYVEASHLTILYVVPVKHSEISSSSCQMCSLSSIMDDSCLDQQLRSMLDAVDQWLQERHALPHLEPALRGDGGSTAGGVVRTVIENPVFLCDTAPPEDQLVISLNNPTFSVNQSTTDLHATQA